MTEPARETMDHVRSHIWVGVLKALREHFNSLMFEEIRTGGWLVCYYSCEVDLDRENGESLLLETQKKDQNSGERVWKI